MPLTVVQAANDLATKLGFTDAATATAAGKQDIVVAINGAMQMLQTAGQDFFTRANLSIPLVVGTSKYTIAGTVQAVIGPILWNDDKPLRALSSRGEYDQYDRIFLGTDTYGAAAGDPAAYWIENTRTGTAGDINAIAVWVVPTPTGTPGTLTAQVVNDAPSYVVADLTLTTVLPVAQSYTESVFLPIARMLVTRSALFSRPDLLAQLTEDSTRALATLAAVGGFPAAVQPSLPREVKA